MAGNRYREVVKTLQWPKIRLPPAKGEIKSSTLASVPLTPGLVIGVTFRLSGACGYSRLSSFSPGIWECFPRGGLTSEIFLSK